MSADASQASGQVVDQPSAAERGTTAATAEAERDSRDQQSSEYVAFSSVFDSAGLPMLRVSAPMYLHFGDRPKLRYQGVGGGSGAGGEGLTAAGGVGAGVGSGVGGHGGGSDSSGGGDGGSGSIGPTEGPKAVPEPAAMLLLTPAVVLAIRRGRRRKSSRS